jgi:hypothetical protein
MPTRSHTPQAGLHHSNRNLAPDGSVPPVGGE